MTATNETRTSPRVKHDTATVQQCPMAPRTRLEVSIEHGVCRHHGCYQAQRCPHGFVNSLIALMARVEQLEAERPPKMGRACSHGSRLDHSI